MESATKAPVMSRLARWLVIPVVLGWFITYNKHLLLKIPTYGFIAYAIMGGPTPPYIDDAIFKHHEEFLKPGSVVLSTPAKSGTTWTMYTLHMLRMRGQPAPFRDIYEEVPWLEFIYYPGQSMDDRIRHLNTASSKYPLRVFKSHSYPPAMPVRDDLKYIVIVRNPFDVAASAREFFTNHGKKFADMWGGFPPNAGEDEQMSEKDFEQFLLGDMGGGKSIAEGLAIDILRNWWPYRNRTNVLILHYADRISDDETQIKRMADFLNLNLTSSEIRSVADQVTYKEMKKVQEKVELRHVFDEYKDQQLIPRDVFILRTDTGGSMMQRGPKRSGNDELSPRFLQKLQDILDKFLGPKALEWYKNGGRIPYEEDLRGQ